jgi:hypothetical protein
MDCANLLCCILSFIVQVGVFYVAIKGFRQTKDQFKESSDKSRNLETIKYMSQIRREIWDIAKDSAISDLEPRQKNMIRQKVEYIATAVNSGVVEKDLVMRLSSKWLCKVIEDCGINDMPESDGNYVEAKRLYMEFDCKD